MTLKEICEKFNIKEDNVKKISYDNNDIECIEFLKEETITIGENVITINSIDFYRDKTQLGVVKDFDLKHGKYVIPFFSDYYSLYADKELNNIKKIVFYFDIEIDEKIGISLNKDGSCQCIEN
jgi:hypothetical protein